MSSENQVNSKSSEEDMDVDPFPPPVANPSSADSFDTPADAAPTDDDSPRQQNMEAQNEPDDVPYTVGWQVSEDIFIPPAPQAFGEYDATGPRLMIVKIVAKNFKSYAGSVVIGPFHKCFSSIVGPNGNGKSNAIDSMLFVFGYRANKIRTKKVAELIHSSNEHPNCSSCTVSVHFQQIIDKVGHDYDIVPNSAFVISRTAFKDSSAYYELDGRKVQFKEITKRLRDHCVDLDHNRFLILQGEVEQIALMKPKGQGDGDTGMLEFLEDIIGTTRYKEPLKKLSDKVEGLSEEREEKLRRLKVVEKAKAELEKPMQEAIQYLKSENSIIKLQHTYYQCKRYEALDRLKKEEEVKKELDEDYNKLMDEMKSVQKERDEKTKDFKEKSKKWDKLQQQKDALTVKTDEMRKKDNALQAEAEATNKRRKENKETVKKEKTKLEEIQRIPAKNVKDIEECEKLQKKQITEREAEEAALANLMSGLKEKTEPLIKKRAKLEKELVTQRKAVDDAKSVFDIAKSKLDLYQSEEQTEKDKLERLKESVKITSDRLSETKKKIAAIEPKIPATEKSLQQAQRELEDLKNRENEANMHLRNKRMKYDEQKSAMQAGTSRNHILNALMREKRESRLPGIYGRLGDLGGIDPKYDVAVSTACGPLDNIVVDSVNTATECIEFLRRNNLGRATFIALEKQQRFARQCQERIRTPENVHRLFDLIKVENPDILPAFYYALQNTLVANDLDQATRIAYGATRYRVVTLKGELIELSGTMSGGGRQVSRGRMGQKAARSEPTAEDISKLQEELDQVFEEYNQVKAKQPPLENQIYTLSTALKDMIVDRDKYKIDINQLTVEEPNLKKQLQEQEKKAKLSICDPGKVRQLSKVVEDAEQKLNSVSETSKETENEVARINHEIDEISGNRVKEQQKKINTLNKNIDKAKGEVCRLQVAIKTAERNAKKTEQRIETLETDIKNCEKRIYDITKEKKEIESVYQGMIEEMEQLDESLTERQELAGKLKSELEKLQSRESKMKALKIDLDQKLNEKNKILKDLQHRIPDLTKAIQTLNLQDIPNEEKEPLTELTTEELEELDDKVVLAQLQKAKEKLPQEIPNMQIIEQFREQNNLYLKRFEKLQKITEERNSMRDSYNLAIRRRMEEFNDGFNMITGKLKEMYRMITLGGDAELELVDSLDPFSEGIVFSVRPPKKSWKQIQNLSGGEKTLSSLALVFALHHYKPTPFYFMDEIDAALDFKNVSIVASYIKDRTKNAQFIVISHRSDMFELADYLVGIYKINNCSHCAALDIAQFNVKVGIVEQPKETNHNPSRFLSQPNPAGNSNSINGTNDSRNSETTRAIPSTCPVNINRHEEIENIRPNRQNGEEEKENQDAENDENDNQGNPMEPSMNFSLGELILPPTPVKQPQTLESKKRKIEKSPNVKSKTNDIPLKQQQKSSKQNVSRQLDQVDEESDNQSSDNKASDDGSTPKRQKTLHKDASNNANQVDNETDNQLSSDNNVSSGASTPKRQRISLRNASKPLQSTSKDTPSPKQQRNTKRNVTVSPKQKSRGVERRSSSESNASKEATTPTRRRNVQKNVAAKEVDKIVDKQSSSESNSTPPQRQMSSRRTRRNEEVSDPSSSDTNTSEGTATPTRRRSLRRGDANSQKADVKSPSVSSEDGTVSLRRTPRTLRKPKFLEDMELSSPTSRKRRKQ
ncbi:structural maintenance of chromosomes protein 4 [Copidosoma floridanum]|uniref:structural maintenance of chromosomes protein 4 n=1 Tax=Copidosoma floridanum TaxID=29053 RepID=UPI0006C9C921|nr:structural maintenance of chromosomes protein 4 [Copidosoma floridanum]XP_014215742.1 structural maintenance of chromosomes protein 4 [Copidosoma floridanum]XP_014215748.1 structural maintenance of chromosomes protein 4 [Copidosoma floridanum]